MSQSTMRGMLGLLSEKDLRILIVLAAAELAHRGALDPASPELTPHSQALIREALGGDPFEEAGQY